MDAAELTEAARIGAGMPSYYRLARLLGVGDGTVANWRHGRATPDDRMAVRLAQLAGLDAPAVVAAMHAQRCTDDALRPVLLQIAERARVAAAVACTAIVSVFVTGTPDAQARASVEDSAPGATAGAGCQKYTSSRLAVHFSHVLGVLRRLAVPMVHPCCT